MGILKGIFKSRDKPKNATSGSAYRFFIGGSSIGKNVNERSAMQMTAVYSCVRILSEAVASLPLHVYKYNSEGGKGEIIALYPLMPNRMTVDRDDKGQLYYQYNTSKDDAPTMKGSMVNLKPSDVLHIPGLGFDGLVGYSPIAMAKNAIGMAMEQYEEAKKSCKDPVILIEQKLDFSCYVPEGFGTGDCIIISDDKLHIIDFKYGQGIFVEAEHNP